MAATTIVNNSPTAGSISWSGFNISYGGKAYAVAAGSSAARYVWWKYNTGATSGTGMPQLLQSDTLPDLAADDILLFLNKGGIGMLVPATTILDGGLVVPDSIMAPAIAADQISTKHLIAGAVEADNIAAGAVSTNALSVGTVSDNLVANGSFEDFTDAGALEGWEVTAATGGTINPVSGVSSSGAVSVQFNATSTGANLRLRQAAARFLPVSSVSGRSWYFSVRMGASVATTKGAYLRVLWFDANRVQLASGGSTGLVSNRGMSTAFAVFEGQATPPAAARYAAVEVAYTSPNVVSKLYVDEVIAYLVTVSARIGDGAITAPKINVDEAFANKVFSGILQGAVVETNSAVDRGVKLSDGGLVAYNATGEETVRLDGANSILTGATIRTAASGARIQISETGLHGWGADNVQYLKADSSGLEMTGSISTKGKTAEAVPRDIAVRLTTLTRDVVGGATVANPAVVFDTGAALGNAPGFYSPDGDTLVINGRLSGVTEFGSLQLHNTKAVLNSRELTLGSSSVVYPTESVSIAGESITIGYTSALSADANVNLLGNVKVNGAAYGAPQARVQPGLSAGWTHVTSNGWNGLWIEQMGKWTTITGCVQKGSYAWNEPITVLSAQYRPASKVPGLNCEIDPAGNLLPGAAGTGARNISISYYAA